MRIDNGRIVLETRACSDCHGEITKQYYRSCPRYGRAVKDLPGRKCPDCGATNKHGHTSLPDGAPQTCKSCHGSGVQAETATDYLPYGLWPALTFRVYRSNRQQTYNEYLLAFGCVYAVTDYGDHAKLTDEQLIAKVRDDKTTCCQACSITRSYEDLTVCDHIGIFCSNNGYSVRKVFVDAPPDLSRERSKADGFAVGTAVAAHGGNGTMAGIFKTEGEQ